MSKPTKTNQNEPITPKPLPYHKKKKSPIKPLFYWGLKMVGQAGVEPATPRLGI